MFCPAGFSFAEVLILYDYRILGLIVDFLGRQSWQICEAERRCLYSGALRDYPIFPSNDGNLYFVVCSSATLSLFHSSTFPVLFTPSIFYSSIPSVFPLLQSSSPQLLQPSTPPLRLPLLQSLSFPLHHTFSL